MLFCILWEFHITSQSLHTLLSPLRHPPFVFNGICRCCLQSYHQFVESHKTNILVNSLLLRNFHVSPLPNNSFSEGLSGGFVLWQEMFIWGSISFIAYFICISFKCVCILRSFHCARFSYNSTNDP